MSQLYLVVAILAIILFLVALYIYAKTTRRTQQLLQHKNDLEKELIKLQIENENLQDAEKKTSDEKFLLQEEVASLNQKKQQLELEKNSLQKDIANLLDKFDDFEKVREKHFEAAKSSMLEASINLSNKLLADHKRENENSQKESQQRIEKTTQELHERFQSVFSSMDSLSKRVDESSKTVNLINSSLLNPQGAGYLSEITLENLLKNLGLLAGVDYEMQYSISQVSSHSSADLPQNYIPSKVTHRPDAIVYLPNDEVLIIDSKSSKFFLESESYEDESERGRINKKLVSSIKKHLKDLSGKDYQTAVRDDLKAKNKYKGEGRIYCLMFMPTDAAAEKISSIEPSFSSEAYKHKIIPAGPAGLANILMQAKMGIERDKQERNYDCIIKEVTELIESIVKLQEHATDFGKGLKKAIGKYNDFAGSFNRNFLSKISGLEELGVSSGKKQEITKLEKLEG